MFKSLISNPMVRAYIAAGVRHLATLGGGILAAWLIKHGASNSDTNTLVTGLAALAVPATSIVFSMIDVKKVDAKVNAAVALAPQSPPEAIQALKNGSF